MMRKLPLKYLIAMSSIILFHSCREEVERTPEQIERAEIMVIEEDLRDNDWGFENMLVSVDYETSAIPLLVNVADENGLVQPGEYDSYDIFGNGKRQLAYTYQFTRDDVLLDTSSGTDFFRIGGYFIINLEKIRINPDSLNAIKFDYQSIEKEGIFKMTADGLQRDNLVESINSRITNSILSGKPDEISESVVNFILHNEKVSQAIESFLTDIIHGKVENLTHSPEETANALAGVIINKLEELDWETIIYTKVLDLLQKLQVDNPEETALELSVMISERIATAISEDDIQQKILPILQEFENETLPVLASRIAEEVFEKISEAISEENVYDRIYPLWDVYSQADSLTIISVSDSMAQTVGGYFFHADTLTEKLIPFVSKVDETKTIKLGDLSQEIIDSVLIPAIDQINGTFPGLGLEPDWESIKPFITSLLTAIKAAAGSSIVEEFSRTLANALMGAMDLILQTGFETALFKMQTIPSDQASTTITAWIINLVDLAEEPVVDLLETNLNMILDKFEAERTSEELSTLIHSTVLQVLGQENLYQLILPVLENLKDADIEKVAQEMADWFIESGLESELLTRDQLTEGLADILASLIGQIEPDQATENLVTLILEGDLVSGIDGNLLSLFLELKTYQLLLGVAKDLNAISKIEISIQKK